jgi:hypothetical protein
MNECDFDTLECYFHTQCDNDTHEYDLHTHECNFHTHECDFYKQNVKSTRKVC